jgi:hypothetical protein
MQSEWECGKSSVADRPMASSTRRVGRCLVQADAVDAAMPGVAAKSWLDKDSSMLMFERS